MISLHWTTCAAIGAMATGLWLGLHRLDKAENPIQAHIRFGEGIALVLLGSLIAAGFLLLRAWGWA